MTEQSSVWEDVNTPVYLHFDYEKFWEISYNSNSKKFQIRLGKLLKQGDEEDVRVHELKENTFAHSKELINAKLKKGYKFLEKNNKKPRTPNTLNLMMQDIDELISNSSRPKGSVHSSGSKSSRGSNLKRKVQENLIHEDIKRVHLNKPLESEKEEKKWFSSTALSPSIFNEDNKENAPEAILIEDEEEPRIKPLTPQRDFAQVSKVKLQSKLKGERDESKELRIEESILDRKAFESYREQKKTFKSELSRSEKEQNKNIINTIQLSLFNKKYDDDKPQKHEHIQVRERDIISKPKPTSPISHRYQPNVESHRETNKHSSIEEPLSSLPNKFKGDYLTYKIKNKLHFCKIQVLGRYVKVENSLVGNQKATDVEISTYRNTVTAEAHAKRMICNKTLSGYRSCPEKFTYDFKPSELGLKEVSETEPKITPIRFKETKLDLKKLLITEEIQEEDNNDEIEDSLALGMKTPSRSGKKSNSEQYNRNSDTKRDVSPLPIIDDIEDVEEDLYRKEGKRPISEPESISPERRGLSSTGLRKNVLGEPVRGCYPSLLKPSKWENQDIKGWYMSEKLDGVRCFWDGREMWSSKGKSINTPKFFIKDFPKSPLDGQLWAGRSPFHKCETIVSRRTPDVNEWNGLVFKVLDAPEVMEPFRKRYEIMRAFFGEFESPYISLHEQKVCKGEEHMKKEVERVAAQGGEGVMLRDPLSFYEKGRSENLLEVGIEDALSRETHQKLKIK